MRALSIAVAVVVTVGICAGLALRPRSKSVSCPQGWYWGQTFQKCLRVQNTPMNWDQAEADCQQYGSHLVSVVSAFEEDELIRIVRKLSSCNYYWIGARRGGNGKYTWSDGTPFDYSNFGPGDETPGLDCVDFRVASNNWHTYGCSRNSDCFVCAKPDPVPQPGTGLTDCAALKASGQTTSGVYTVTVSGVEYNVYCDMETEGGGWTVIQQRVDDSLTFWNQKWKAYKEGFGDLGSTTNFWGGNELIHAISTKDASVVLRIDMWGDRNPGSPHKNDYWYSEYYFSLDDEASDYTVHAKFKRVSPGSWTGVGNASANWYDITCSDGVKFSTVDRINDPMPKCVTYYRLGGWWLHYCTLASLNGAYTPLKYGDGYGLMWTVEGSYIINPVKTRMSLRVEQN